MPICKILAKFIVPSVFFYDVVLTWIAKFRLACPQTFFFSFALTVNKLPAVFNFHKRDRRCLKRKYRICDYLRTVAGGLQ